MVKVKTKYPRKHDATCIVCDDVRVEKSNKLILVGVYPGQLVNFNSSISKDAPGLTSLAFCFWFHNFVGESNVKVFIRDSNSKNLKEAILGIHVGEKDRALNIILPPTPFSFEENGAYTVIVSFDEREYVFPLTITSPPIE